LRNARKLFESWTSAALFGWALAIMGGCAPTSDVLGTVASPTAGDAGAHADAPGAASDARVLFGPRFATPVLVAALANPAADDEDPSFTGDLRELYFSSTRAGTSDIWVSRRASPADPWGQPVVVSELSSSGIDRSPSVSLDGLAIWFTSDRELFRGRIWRSTRDNRLGAWAAPAPVSELASPNFDSAPSVDAAETTMFFASLRMQSTSGTDIFASSRATVGAPWGVPERVVGLDTSADEADPFVAEGGLVVFFTMTRAGQQGDLYWSARRSTEAPFPTAQPLNDVNSPFVDSDATLSADLLYLMFASNRSGNTEIYESHALD
jgi:WD40-like Beta Propeller Repeat